MRKVSVEEAQAQLQGLIHSLVPEEEIILTENGVAVARLNSVKSHSDRKLGTLRGTVTYVAWDFNAALGDFTEDMK
ncbi:MAG: hypothetical protein WCC87_12370 [Candidatus Korobacteraceae bacterium]